MEDQYDRNRFSMNHHDVRESGNFIRSSDRHYNHGNLSESTLDKNVHFMAWENHKEFLLRIPNVENSENESYGEDQYTDSPDSATIPALNFPESISSCTSYSEEVEAHQDPVRNPICLVSKSISKGRSNVNAEKLLRNSESESASNDEASESTIVSLGQKIKQMASSHVHWEQGLAFEKEPPIQYREYSLDEEWKGLLRNNHELLLRGDKKTKDELKTPLKIIPNIIISKNEENNETEGSVNKYNEQDKSKEKGIPPKDKTEKWQQFLTVPCVLEDIEEVAEVNSPFDNYIKLNLDIEEKLQGPKTNDTSFSSNSELTSKLNHTNVVYSSTQTFPSISTQQEVPPSSVASNKSDAKGSSPPKSAFEASMPDDTNIFKKSSNSEGDFRFLKSTLKDGKNEGSTRVNAKLNKATSLPSSPKTVHFATDMEKPSSSFQFKVRPFHPSLDVVNAIKLIEDQEKKDQQSRTPRMQDGRLSSEARNNEENEQQQKDDDKNGKKCKIPESTLLADKILIFAEELRALMNDGTSEDKLTESLQTIYKAEKILEDICFKEGKKPLPKDIPGLHNGCEKRFNAKYKEFEDRIHKNLDLIRKLLDDKKELTEKCEMVSKEMNQAEKKHLDKVKLLEDKHTLELQNLRDKLSTAEQVRRQKWTQQKAKLLKDSSYRSLEGKMKEQAANHREEMNSLKEQQWTQQRDTEDKWIQKLRDLEQQMKEKSEKEKEEQCQKEREKCKERYDLELKQSESLWKGHLDTLQKQFSRSKIEKEDETQRQIAKLKSEQEDELRTLKREAQLNNDNYEEKLRTILRNHENELANLRQSNERAQNEWREQVIKNYDEIKQKSEKELRERLGRQRDKEIENAIKEIEQETELQLAQTRRTADAKIKNLKERYDTEMNEMESSERICRSRYLEMKGILAQKEEEIVYLRARLHTQGLELNDFQEMFQVQNR